MNWDYIAGFFDGEGWTGANFHKGTRSLRTVWQVTQKHNAVLYDIKVFLEQHGYHPRVQINGSNLCSALLVYRIHEVEKILQELLPRLVVKRDQASVVLDIIASREVKRAPYKMKADSRAI